MRFLPLIVLLFISPLLIAQSSFFLQNNTDLDLTIDVSQKGSFILPDTVWSANFTGLEYWSDKEKVLDVRRDTLFQPGDTAIFEMAVSANADTLWLEMMIVKSANGSNLFYSTRGGGFNYPWQNVPFSTEETISFGGLDCTFKYKPENNDATESRDVFFIIHQQQLYSIDEADFANANVLNVMSYNIQFLFFVSNNFFERASMFPAHISPYQDVVVFQEVFDTITLHDVFIPALEAEGFIYNSGILNSTTLPNSTKVVNGGVIIFSKWPIVKTDEVQYTNCESGSSDCFAAKGVKYAKVNKLGVNYHIFGSHLQAGGGLAVKTSQFGQIKDFIAAQQISKNEGVIMGGDFNTSAFDVIQYPALLDSIKHIKPDHYGIPNSTFNGNPGKVIDYVLAFKEYLLPINANNGIITVRGIDSLMWPISEFSDHRTIVSRFEYPGITPTPKTQVICPINPISLELNVDNTFNYSWFKDGVALNVNDLTYDIPVPSINDEGVYTIDLSYSFTVGAQNNVVNNAFYPNGSETFSGNFTITAANLTYSDVCPVGINESNALNTIKVYPTLTKGTLMVENLPINNLVDFAVYNTTGQKVLVVKATKGEKINLDVSNLESGFYILEINAENAKAVRSFYKAN